MGYYEEYLTRQISFEDALRERKNQLKLISDAHDGHDVIVYAADMVTHHQAPTGIDYSDTAPFCDQLSNLHGSKLDIILETPGGLAEVVEDFVRVTRSKYNDISIIVPGWAKSAGTIFAMAADHILMSPASALGPIDAQVPDNGDKLISADEYIDGLEAILKRTHDEGSLNPAYIPILQHITPGTLQHFRNAKDFSKTLVRKWLFTYKFKNWQTHSHSGEQVTDDERRAKADEIAEKLADNKVWLTHGRSIGMTNLIDLGLKIDDFTKDSRLNEAIMRYYALLRISFDTANVFKITETRFSQIYRLTSVASAPRSKLGAQVLDAECGKCHTKVKVQYNLNEKAALKEGCVKYPLDTNRLFCKNCHSEINLTDFRRQAEAESGMVFVGFIEG